MVDFSQLAEVITHRIAGNDKPELALATDNAAPLEPPGYRPDPLLQELIRYVPAVVFCHQADEDFRCLFVSESFETTWGLPCTALKRDPWAWLLSVVPEDRDFVRGRIRGEYDLGAPQEMEFRIRQPGGALRHIQTRFVNLRNPEGDGVHCIGFATDITERRHAEAEAFEVSHIDPLTQLPNRLAFSEAIARLLSEGPANCGCHDFYVVFLDIDRFSRINDTLGHTVGDEYLCKISEQIKQFVGSQGIVARIGGDEFAVLLSNCREVSSARSRLTALQQSLTRPIMVDGEAIVTGASLGVVQYPKHGDDPGSLMRMAESAMMFSKSRRRGSMSFYSESMNLPDARQRLRREMALKQALKADQFELFFQGKFNSHSRSIQGAEALLRWRHPEYGLVSPAEFIPLLEDSGDIIDVGQWVIEQACQTLATWQGQGLASDFIMAVNIAPAQLLYPGFAEVIRIILQKTGIAADQLELELTESAILVDPEQAKCVFDQLRALGVRLAIDDFGTGYSSMSYLRRFRPDTLKIDRSFVQDCAHDETALGITESIIQLGRTLDMTIVAEGIETEDQARCLTRSGCHLLQGFLLARPCDAGAFQAALL